jgi:hypothetical protein
MSVTAKKWAGLFMRLSENGRNGDAGVSISGATQEHDPVDIANCKDRRNLGLHLGIDGQETLSWKTHFPEV